MKTIPQKCFRPYQKTDDRVRYNTYDGIGKEKRVFQERCLEFIKLIFWN
jgi:hypothetical protein